MNFNIDPLLRARMSQLARKFLDDRAAPARVELPVSKSLLEESPTTSNAHINKMGDYLRGDHVDRRCARAQGAWNPKKRSIRIFKSSPELTDKRVLGPKQAFVYVEANKLEIFHNKCPMSLLEVYTEFFGGKYDIGVPVRQTYVPSYFNLARSPPPRESIEDFQRFFEASHENILNAVLDSRQAQRRTSGNVVARCPSGVQRNLRLFDIDVPTLNAD